MNNEEKAQKICEKQCRYNPPCSSLECYMNPILQKRIEEAADEYQNLVIEETKCHHNHTMTYAQGYEDARLLVKPTFIDAVNWALQNQWISVEEALPEKNVFVFVRGENTLGTFFNSDYIGCNGNWYLLSNYGTVPDRKITHWMPIPNLEGGEE